MSERGSLQLTLVPNEPLQIGEVTVVFLGLNRDNPNQIKVLVQAPKDVPIARAGMKKGPKA
jgi:sRNA-binding carbon storage regulator CsrA